MARAANRWRAEDDFELLAYLQHCRNSDPSGKLFKETIQRHLKNECRKTTTQLQITKRLEALWEAYAVKNSLVRYTGDSIPVHGLSCLSIFTKDRTFQKQISRRVQQLATKKYNRSPSKSRKHPESKIQTRDASLAVSTNNRSPLGRTRAGARVPQHRRLRARTRKRARTISEKQDHPSISEHLPPVTKDVDENVLDEHHFDTSTTILSKKTETREFRYKDAGTQLGESAQAGIDFLHPCSEPSTPSATGDLFSEPSTPSSSASGDREFKAAMLLTRQSNCESGASQGSHGAWTVHGRTLRCKTDLQWYRQKLVESERENQVLRNELHSTQHAVSILETQDKDHIASTLTSYLRQIEDLRSINKGNSELYRFTKGRYKQSSSWYQDELKQVMSMMVQEIDGLMLDDQTLKPCRIASSSDCSKLNALCRRACGGFDNLPINLPFQSLLRSLVSAAVCEWVFEIDFRPKCMAGSDLMTNLLEHLKDHDGEDVVRNLHFAAHHTLVHSEYFGKMLIPRRARSLAKRLLRVMHPLFEMHRPDQPWTSDMSIRWKEQEIRMDNIFTAALKVKTQALLSGNVFEVYFPPAGTAFDPEWMEIEEWPRSSEHIPCNPRPTVCISLAPALRWFNFDRILVDYNSFREPSEAERESFDQIGQPIVMIA